MTTQNLISTIGTLREGKAYYVTVGTLSSEKKYGPVASQAQAETIKNDVYVEMVRIGNVLAERLAMSGIISNG